MPRVRHDGWCLYLNALEACVIPGRDRTPCLGPRRQVRKLDSKDRRLNGVESEVAAFECIDLWLSLTPVSQRPRRPGHIGVVRHDDAALASRRKVLRRVEAETSHVTEAAHRLPVVRCPVGLARVFDDRETMLSRHRTHRVHVDGLTE